MLRIDDVGGLQKLFDGGIKVVPCEIVHRLGNLVGSVKLCIESCESLAEEVVFKGHCSVGEKKVSFAAIGLMATGETRVAFSGGVKTTQ